MLLLRYWRSVAGAGLLLVLGSGPVLRFASGVLDRPLDRPGHWNDSAVWPFFAGAAAMSAVLAWAVWLPGNRVAGPTERERLAGRPALGKSLSRPALAALAWYSAAAVASSLWSVSPGATLWRSVVYVGLGLLAVALAGLPADELSATLALLASAAVTASLVVVAVRHDIGTDHNGDWMGVYTNRNSLAPLAGLGVIAGLRWLIPTWTPRARFGSRGVESWGNPTGEVGAAPSGGRRVWGALLVAAALATLMGAGSRSAWLALAAALSWATALGAAASGAPRTRRWGRWRKRAAVSAAALAAMGVGVAVAAAVWQMPTFSQRRTIWSLIWDRVLERPWGGHGFFAFWEVPGIVEDDALFQLGSAHNSLVETALGLGVLGVAPFAILVALAAVNASRDLWLRPSVDTRMWAAVTVFVLLENVTESFVLWFSHIWVLLVAAALRRSAPAASSTATAAVTASGPGLSCENPPTVRQR